MAKVWSVGGGKGPQVGGRPSPTVPSAVCRKQAAGFRDKTEREVQLMSQRAERMRGLAPLRTKPKFSVLHGILGFKLLEGTWMVHFLCVVSEPLFCLGDTLFVYFDHCFRSPFFFSFFSLLTPTCLSSK